MGDSAVREDVSSARAIATVARAAGDDCGTRECAQRRRSPRSRNSRSRNSSASPLARHSRMQSPTRASGPPRAPRAQRCTRGRAPQRDARPPFEPFRLRTIRLALIPHARSALRSRRRGRAGGGRERGCAARGGSARGGRRAGRERDARFTQKSQRKCTKL